MNNRFEHGSFANIRYALLYALVNRAKAVDVGEWQSLDISDKPEMVTRELFDVTLRVQMPDLVDDMIEAFEPNMPWAEDHFQERVSGEPLNPPPSHEWWPFNKQNEVFQKDEKFSHTYPERFWPKEAGDDWDPARYGSHRGIRFEYGDLIDVVNLLQRSPLTRQAYLPVWFPEDTGAHHGERVPCTLGYHFIIREGRLNVIYYIRSCDFLRHFRDDVYLAARLGLWVYDSVSSRYFDIEMGTLTMHITSLHVFEADMPTLRSQLEANP
jgi:hypothetical protein